MSRNYASYEKRVLRVLKYIHENPADDLSLDALADIALMSRFHWHRVFQAMTGATCAQAVRRIRLYRASSWLLGSDKTVAEIATAVGYPNIQSFTRAFNETFGVLLIATLMDPLSLHVMEPLKMRVNGAM